MEALLIVLVIGLAMLFLNEILKKNSKAESKIDNSLMPYKEKYILTKNEYDFYNELKKITDEKDLIICPKVGLKDLFDITTKNNYMAYFGKISQKHIDFLICDKQLRPKFAIELDDNSHTRKQNSDDFKNRIFQTSKIKLIRIKACTDYSTEYILRNFDFEDSKSLENS